MNTGDGRAWPAPMALCVYAVLLLGASPLAAQEPAEEDAKRAQSSEQTSSSGETQQNDEQQAPEGGYPVERKRLVGGPTDVTTDLITSFPKPDSVLPSLIPGKWFTFKEKAYEKTGVKLSFSYQALYQNASDTLGLLDADFVFSGYLVFEAKWNAYRRGEDYQGSLTTIIDWRTAMGGGAPSALYGPLGVGSLWATDVAFDDLGPTVPLFYWEQWFKKDVFVLRVGKQLASQTYDFFRFKDPRSSFTASPFTLHNSIPHPPFGQGVSFEWWPNQGSELYLQGTLNDMNGDPERFGLDTFFQDRQYFYGFEIGYFWKRNFPADFDHIHLDVFYADERAEPSMPGFPNKAGGGFKVLGSKQVGRLVGFGSYTFNTAEGGGFSLSFARHTVTGGLAVLKPAGIRGEVGVGLSWMDAFEDVTLPVIGDLRNQFGSEVYWKLLLMPDLWITPGVQFVWNPAFNPAADFVAVPQLKFRLFF